MAESAFSAVSASDKRSPLFQRCDEPGFRPGGDDAWKRYGDNGPEILLRRTLAGDEIRCHCGKERHVEKRNADLQGMRHARPVAVAQ